MTKNDSPKQDRLYKAIVEQIEIMARLRAPVGGCPWDIVQDFDTIAPFTIEEAYEVADAVRKRDFGALKEELGDLVFQVAFHARMAEEQGLFDFKDVVETLNEKMVRRHEHVFGDVAASSPTEVLKNWEKIKAAERNEKSETDQSVLKDVALPLPALLRALKLSKRAARVGFDWPDTDEVFKKFDEELRETKEAIASNDKAHIEEEIGDLLFVLANLARKCDIDPENALRLANYKFERRFRAVEDLLIKDGIKIEETSLEKMEEKWLEVKFLEKTSR